MLCCVHGAIFVGEPEPFAAKPQSTPSALGLGSPIITRIAHDLLQIGREECLASAVANGLGTLQDLVKAMETFVGCSITGIGVYHTKRKRGNFGHC